MIFPTAFKTRVVLAAAFAVSALVLVAVFVGFQTSGAPNSGADSEGIAFAADSTVAVDYATDVYTPAALAGGDGFATDATIAVADFGQSLDEFGGRLSVMEEALAQQQGEWASAQDSAAQNSQALAAEMSSVQQRVAELAAADDTLHATLSQVLALLEKLQSEQPAASSSTLPVAGLKLLSVSIWDDGAVAIVSLGSRTTGLSLGNYFAGLKVEALSVAEQSLTLYEPATNKLYTLYADAIVYQEAQRR